MKLQRLKTYWQVWLKLATLAVQSAFIDRFSNIFFMVGKTVRLLMTLLLMWLIQTNVPSFAGYSSSQIVLFFMTYHIVDLVSQILFRGVYYFSGALTSGEYDQVLIRPIKPLFMTIMGHPDINDTIFLFPSLALFGWIVSNLGLTFTLPNILWYCFLLLNGLMISLSLHVIVVASGMLTTQIDSAIWVLRDLTAMGKFPVVMYQEWLRFALFFIVPTGMMITIPTEVLIGHQPSYSIGVVVLTNAALYLFAMTLWKYGLRRYTSASS